MKVSDYIANFIASRGIRHVFTLPGGFSMHLNDSIGYHPDLTAVYMLDERSAAIAAMAYAQASDGLGVCVVTAGPGVTNAITGVAAAWLDSVPMLVISGDIKTADLHTRGVHALRQGGAQDVPTSALVSSIVKRCYTPRAGSHVALGLADCVSRALSDRPGPVWFNVPIDVQAQQVGNADWGIDIEREYPNKADIDIVLEALSKSERPILLLGNGINCAHARKDALVLVDLLGIPVMTTWPALDIVPFDHPLFVGRPGLSGMRAANLALQEADLLLCIGARLDSVTTAYNYADFGRNARKIVVDADHLELYKLGQNDMGILADAGDFIHAILAAGQSFSRPEWSAHCQELKAAWPMSSHCTTGTYALVDILSEITSPDDVFTPAPSSQAGAIFLAAFRNKAGQRVHHASALGSTGFDIPAAIGACLGSGGKRTICVTGDGGIMQNIQELETITRLKLPIKVFVMNNGGYDSIRKSQLKHFARTSGVFEMPVAAEMARTFGVANYAFDATYLNADIIRASIDFNGPYLVEILVPTDEPLMPRVETVIGADGIPRSGVIDRMVPDIWSD